MATSRLMPLLGLVTLSLSAVPAFAGAGQTGLGKLDANHDGVISRQEAVAAEKRAFHHLDKNGDGEISWPEFNSGQMGEPGQPNQTRAEKRRRERARKAWFHNLDRNGDGTLSLSEYEAGLTPYFDRLDTNGDGVIDGQEMKKAMQDDRPPAGR